MPSKPTKKTTPRRKTIPRNSIQAMARRMRELKDRKAVLSKEEKEINKELSGYMDGDDFVVGLEVRLAEKLIDEGMKNCKVDGIGTVYLHEDTRPNVMDEEGFFAYLRARECGHMIKESVNYNTLRGFINELKANFQPLPDESIVKINDRTVARLRRT